MPKVKTLKPGPKAVNGNPRKIRSFSLSGAVIDGLDTEVWRGSNFSSASAFADWALEQALRALKTKRR